MVTKPVKFGIISYGHYFRTNFVVHLAKCPAVEIVGVYNRGEERRLQARQDGYFSTGNLDELLSLPGLEAVAIGSSNAAHKEQVLAAAKAGKHVLCEKPLALELADVDEMVAAAEQKGLVTHVNHGGPYMDRFIRFKSLMEEHIGKVYHCWLRSSRMFGLWSQGARHVAVANPKESGGWTFHHLCHALDEACVLLGTSEAEKVYHVNQKSCPEAPSEEIINSLIHFRNGTTALLTDGTSVGGFGDFGVQGEGGDMRLLGDRITLVRPGPLDPTERPGNRGHVIDEFDVPAGDKMIETVGAKFVQAVRGGKNELLSFRFVSNQYRILNAMRKSAETGQAVSL